MQNNNIPLLKNQYSKEKELTIKDFEKSGINEDTIQVMDIIPVGNDTISRNKIEEALGYYPFGRDSILGYLIPYKNAIEDDYTRLKILNPGPQDPKYLSPQESHTKYTQHLYMLDKDWEYRKKSKADIFITEGEKKTAKLSQEIHKLDTEDKKHVVIGLAGITMWRYAPEWADINITNKTVYIVFDADYINNPDVAREGLELAVFLKIVKKAKDIKIITWDFRRGKGIDDYLVNQSNPFIALQDLIEHSSDIKPYLDMLNTEKAIQYIAEVYYKAVLNEEVKGINPKNIKMQIGDIIGLLAQKGITIKEITTEIYNQILRKLSGEKIPKGYYVNNGWIYKDDGTQISRYCWIKHFIYYPEEDKTNMVIRVSEGENEIREFIISANITDPRKLGDYFRASDYDTAKNICKYLSAYHKKNANDLKTIIAIKRTGWYKDNYLLPTSNFNEYTFDNTIITSSIRLSDNNQNDLYIRQKRKLAEVIKTKAGLSCLSVLFAPLVSICKTPNFFLNLSGLPGAGKTTAHRFAMSLFGDPNKLMATLNATQVGVEKLADYFRDFPLWLDELDTVSRNNKKDINHLINIIYNYTQGKGKTRSTKDLNIRHTAVYRGIALTSMEQDINNIINSQKTSRPTGLNRRVLDINITTPEDLFAPLNNQNRNKDINTYLKELNNFAFRNYGAIGKKWIEYIQEKRDILETDYEKNLNDWFADVNIAGLEQFLCGLYTTAQHLQKAFDINTKLIQEYIKNNLTKEVAKEYQNASITKERILTDLKEYIHLNTEHFVEKKNGTLTGFNDNYYKSIWGEVNIRGHEDETVYEIKILTTPFRNFCNDYGYSPKSILKILDECNILHKNRNKKSSIIRLSIDTINTGKTLSGYHFIFKEKEDEDGNIVESS